MSASGAAASQAEQNRSVWSQGRFIRQYAHRELRPVEVLALVRYRDDFSGEVLELGCGAGRIAGYLCEIARTAHGIDLSPAMVAECRRRYPSGAFAVGDIRDLGAFADGSLDAVVAGCNVLDVFPDHERRATLREVHRVLRPEGLFVMSSHNRAYLPRVRRPWQLRRSDPLRFGFDLIRAPLHWRRHRRLAALEEHSPDHAIVSDGAHGYTLLHYFIDQGAQRRQLGEEGFTLIEVLDLDGRRLAPEEPAAETVELHYVARRR